MPGVICIRRLEDDATEGEGALDRRPEQGMAFAVLIDADNASARHADPIFAEVATFGEAMIRRIYGDFARNSLNSWDRAVQAHAILQQQQRSNTTGKNASDIALVIDAMDLMHKGTLGGVCAT